MGMHIHTILNVVAIDPSRGFGNPLEDLITEHSRFPGMHEGKDD